MPNVPLGALCSLTDWYEASTRTVQVQSRLNLLKITAALCILIGIGIMLIGNVLSRRGPDLFFVAGAAYIIGWAFFIWGCLDYARWKGYSGWFGFLGFLLVPGLIILVCLPNRRKELLEMKEFGTQSNPAPPR